MTPDPVRAAIRALPGPVCAYVYDTAALRATATRVRAALPPPARLYYAVKANGHPSVLAALAATCDGLEVASGGELELALATGARRIAFGGPAKTPGELAAAVRAATRREITLNVESPLELRRLVAVGAPATNDAAPPGPRVALRVNRVGVSVTGSHQMTGVPTPFGMDEADLPEAVAIARDGGLDLVGFHLHAVSNNLDAAAHVRFAHDAVDWSRRAADRLGIDLREVNVGGGFGVDYTGDRRFDLGALAGLPDGVPLVFELGRYLTAAAGWYAAEVLDLKRVHGRWFAVLRGGTHHFRLPAAWGYSHPFDVVRVERWSGPGDRPEVRDTPVDAVGELCTPRDVLARDRRVDQLRVGDVLVFANAGGYGWDISHHEFLRHPYPQIVVL
jgi:diaminopimelate decarboxylase